LILSFLLASSKPPSRCVPEPSSNLSRYLSPRFSSRFLSFHSASLGWGPRICISTRSPVIPRPLFQGAILGSHFFSHTCFIQFQDINFIPASWPLHLLDLLPVSSFPSSPCPQAEGSRGSFWYSTLLYSIVPLVPTAGNP
jgi:hypothetical protein